MGALTLQASIEITSD